MLVIAISVGRENIVEDSPLKSDYMLGYQARTE